MSGSLRTSPVSRVSLRGCWVQSEGQGVLKMLSELVLQKLGPDAFANPDHHRCVSTVDGSHLPFTRNEAALRHKPAVQERATEE